MASDKSKMRRILRSGDDAIPDEFADGEASWDEVNKMLATELHEVNIAPNVRHPQTLV